MRRSFTITIYPFLLLGCAVSLPQKDFSFKTYKPTPGAQQMRAHIELGRILHQTTHWVRLDCTPFLNEEIGQFFRVDLPALNMTNNWAVISCKETYSTDTGLPFASTAPCCHLPKGQNAITEPYDISFPDSESSLACGPQQVYITAHIGSELIFKGHFPKASHSQDLEVPYAEIRVPYRRGSNGRVRVTLSCDGFARFAAEE